MDPEGFDYGRAIPDLDETIRLAPDYTLAYFWRGSAWWAMRENDRAIADLNEAIRRAPENAAWYCMRSDAWYAKKEVDTTPSQYSGG